MIQRKKCILFLPKKISACVIQIVRSLGKPTMSKSLSVQSGSKRKVSLTVRVSALLVLAVVVPLIITVLSSEFILRPTLLTQAANDMESDAQTHAQAVHSYLMARTQELGAVGQY